MVKNIHVGRGTNAYLWFAKSFYLITNASFLMDFSYDCTLTLIHFYIPLFCFPVVLRRKIGWVL